MIHKFKSFILFLLPVLYIAYIMYIRIFLTRDIRILYIQLSVLQIITTIIIIILLLWRIYVLLKYEGVLGQKPKKNKIILWLRDNVYKVSEKFSEIWIDFFRVFTKASLKFNLIIVSFAQFLHTHKTFNKFLTILIIFEVLPKLIVVTAFLTDIFIFYKFYYFYKTLVLLLLPLIYSTLRAMLLQFYADNAPAQESFITKKLVQAGGFFQIEYAFVDKFKPPHFIKGIQDFVENHYLPLTCIPNTLSYLDGLKGYYKINWLLIAILCLHILGWSTILLFGIHF